MAIELIDEIKPKNNGDFHMVRAEYVAYGDGRLPDYMPICLSQEEYDALKAADNLNPLTPYLIVSDDE